MSLFTLPNGQIAKNDQHAVHHQRVLLRYLNDRYQNTNPYGIKSTEKSKIYETAIDGYGYHEDEQPLKTFSIPGRDDMYWMLKKDWTFLLECLNNLPINHKITSFGYIIGTHSPMTGPGHLSASKKAGYEMWVESKIKRHFLYELFSRFFFRD